MKHLLNKTNKTNMKTAVEIGQLAEQYLNIRLPKNGHNGYIDAYIKGYTQCQEDVGDERYTEEDVINLMFMATKWDTFKDGDVEYGMDMDSFFKYLINSLKQD